jgi:predicted nucleotide-binding protein
MEGVWSDILQAGIVIAELSTPNPNVFYELGLVHALGKDTVILKEKAVKLPADFLGTLYVEYDAGDKQKALKDLQVQLEAWKEREKIDGVARLYLA